jgi:hypothetical protein
MVVSVSWDICEGLILGDVKYIWGLKYKIFYSLFGFGF